MGFRGVFFSFSFFRPGGFFLSLHLRRKPNCMLSYFLSFLALYSMYSVLSLVQY